MKLTKNFDLYEFAPSTKMNKNWKPESEYQMELVKALANTLQIIRDAITAKYGERSITINSGVRLASDFERLTKQGYNPSPTSDHFCGSVITSPKRNGKSAFFDGLWFLSTGAVDFVVEGLELEKVVEIIRELISQGKICVGQVILETGKNTKWIHLSNGFALVKQILVEHGMLRQRDGQFLRSTDNGKTYTQY